MESQRRSRGSFVDVRRKSLTLTNIFTEVTQEEPNVEKPKHSMQSYLDSLKKEKQDWKDILKEKKTKCKTREKEYKYEPLIVTRADVEKYMTPEDKEFLENRPNYLGMVNSVRMYIDAVNYLNKYKVDIIDYYGKACNELEIDKKVLVENMCAPDLCEICNIKNCQTQEHKFNIEI